MLVHEWKVPSEQTSKRIAIRTYDSGTAGNREKTVQVLLCFIDDREEQILGLLESTGMIRRLNHFLSARARTLVD